MASEKHVVVEDRFSFDDNDVSVHIMTPQEAWERFDHAAMHYLHLTGREFIDAWDFGKFDDDPDRPEVMRVAMLRPSGR